MSDLIKALQIFLKYSDNKWPTHCEHDILMIADILEDDISEDDRDRLKILGFDWNDEYQCFASGRFGSA
jgi:hypothetical protein